MLLERLSLDSLKGVNMSQVKSMSDAAMKNIKQLGKKRMSVAGYSVSPWLIGGAALLAGGYLLYRSKSRSAKTTVDDTTMQGQVHPVK